MKSVPHVELTWRFVDDNMESLFYSALLLWILTAASTASDLCKIRKSLLMMVDNELLNVIDFFFVLRNVCINFVI